MHFALLINYGEILRINVSCVKVNEWMNEWMFISLKQKYTFMNEKKWKLKNYIGKVFTNSLICFFTEYNDLQVVIDAGARFHQWWMLL